MENRTKQLVPVPFTQIAGFPIELVLSAGTRSTHQRERFVHASLNERRTSYREHCTRPWTCKLIEQMPAAEMHVVQRQKVRRWIPPDHRRRLRGTVQRGQTQNNRNTEKPSTGLSKSAERSSAPTPPSTKTITWRNPSESVRTWSAQSSRTEIRRNPTEMSSLLEH